MAIDIQERMKKAMQQAKANDRANVDAVKNVTPGLRVSGSNNTVVSQPSALDASDYDGVGGFLKGVGQNAFETARSALYNLQALSKSLPVQYSVAPAEGSVQQAREMAAAARAGDENKLSELERQAQERSEKRAADREARIAELEQKADESAERAAEIREATVGDSNALVQGAFDVGTGGLQLLGDIALNSVLPGAGAATMFARAAGGAIGEARNEGATTGQQLLYGLGSGALEFATEKISNVAKPLAKMFGKGVADDVVEATIKKLTGTESGRSVLRVLASGAGEGFEEAVSTLVNPVLQRIYDENALEQYSNENSAQLVSDALYDATIGAVLGGLVQLPGSVISSRRSRRASSGANTSSASQNVENNAPAADSADANVSEGNVTTRPAEAAVEAPTASQTASEVEQILSSGNVSNSAAERIINTPELRAQYEAITGQRLTGTKSEMRNAIKQAAAQIREQAAANTFLNDAAEATGRVTAQDANVSEILNSSPVQNVNTPVTPDSSAAVNPTDSLGAAPAGFDRFSAALNQYGEMPERGTGAREMSVPRAMNDSTVVPRTVQTFANAGATPESTYTEITRLLEEGGFDRAVITNQAALARAEETITREGFNRALTDWTATVRSGRVSKNTTTLGLTLYNNAINAGDTQTAIQILVDIVDNARTAAQATQAMDILNKLTPEGRLYSVQRSVASLQEEVNRNFARRFGENAQQDVYGALRDVEQQRDDALNVISEIADAYRGGEQTGGADWVGQIANGLAANLSTRLRAQGSGQTPIGRVMVQDMVRLAEQSALPQRQRGQTQRRSAIETLQNYIYNRAEYDAAWRRAQDEIRRRYQNNPEALAAFDEWLNSTTPYQGSAITQSPMFRAVAEEAAAQELSRNTAAVRAEYGDAQALATDLANSITSKLDGAAAQDQAAIYAAALEYVNSRTPTGGRAASDVVDSELRKTMRDAGVRMSEIIRQGASTKAEVANNLAQALVNEFGFSEQNAQTFATDVVDRFNAQVAEASQRALEARFKERSPAQRRTLAERLTELANMGAFSSDQYNSLATQQLFGRELPPEIKLDETLVSEFLNAPDEDTRLVALDNIYKDVARQVPSDWYDKLNAWRYFAMLANPRTHVRNILGNTLMRGVSGLRDRLSGAMQSVFVRDRNQRTRSNLNRAFNVEDEARYNVAYDEYKRVSSMIADAGKYRNELNQIRKYMQPLKGAVGKLANANSALLEWEDMVFSRGAYARNLAQFLKARGITAEQYVNNSISQEVKAEAQAFAIQEAQRATFRDFNEFSDLIQKLANLGGDTGVGRAYRTIVSSVLPFTRTPANILVRGVTEYSPIGIMRGVGNMLTDVRRGNMTAGEAIDQLASGFVGTGIMALGALLSKLGLVTGSGAGDDQEQAMQELTGFQPYALQVDGNSYTLDWLAPAALPFFVGVEVQKLFENSGADDDDLLRALGSITQPMLEMSMLSGVDDLLDSVSYANNSGTSPIWAALASAATSYISQYFPSVFGAIERTVEDQRYTTYTDPNSPIPSDFQYAISQAMNRLPFEYNQVDYIDAWGDTESTGSVFERALENFLSPGYYNESGSSHRERELQRIYEETGESVIPERVSPNEKYTKKNADGTTEEIHLASEGLYEEYVTTLGETQAEGLDELFTTAVYRNMSSQDKARTIKRVEEYAREVARQAIDPDYEMDGVNASAFDAAAQGIEPANYLAYAQNMSQLKSDKDENGDTVPNSLKNKVVSYINSLPLTPAQKDWIYAERGYAASTLADTPWH